MDMSLLIKKNYLLFLIICLVLFPLSVYADKCDVKIVCDSTSVVVGEELTCYIKGAADYEVGSFSGKIGSDSKLSLTDITVDSFWGMKNINKTSGKITVSGKNPDSDRYTGGNINTKFNFATFKVKGVTVGSSMITISDVIVTYNYNDIELNNVSTKIEVVSKSGGTSSGGSNLETNGGNDRKEYTALFDSNGGILTGDNFKSCIVNEGTSCVIDELPSVKKDGYVFTGWGNNKNCTNGDDFSLILTRDETTFYACWDVETDEVTNKNDNIVEDNSDGFKISWIVIVLVIGVVFASGYLIYYYKDKK